MKVVKTVSTSINLKDILATDLKSQAAVPTLFKTTMVNAFVYLFRWAND